MHRPPVPGAPALFLDVDGTLIDIAANPQAVRVPPPVVTLLSRLHRAAQGAVALVSGRSLDELDRLFHPLTLPAAGVHGAERRSADGAVHRLPAPPLPERDAVLEALRTHHPGVVIEDKGVAVAVHYRAAPAAEGAVRAAVAHVVDRSAGRYRVQAGKMVCEIVPAEAGKDRSVRAFMEERPFRGRVPVFVGDDVTDEQGFAAAAALGGFGVRVGAVGTTVARWQVPSVAAALDWLSAMADGCA